MGGGAGGFMHDANKRLQQNRNLLKRNSLFNNQDKSISPKGDIKQEHVQPLSSEQKSYVNELLIKRQKEERIRFIKRLIIALIGGFLLAYILWSWMQV
ncbi:hypothetical protein [Fulvivirga lutea]|uniref:Transmembrane protein n=1 Tax=Fulvivirga lutea TaxID=2810512 RepID=A0A974WH89_9BACT|nr:hypothetical protein [Fulvivirga lutea]QSE96065.1 hypothetical protein JR347_10600 [Fulvivirga lutea]